MDTQPWKNCAGICLAEFMIAMAAGAVVLSATILTLNHFQHRLLNQHDTMARHQDMRIGLRVMEAELRVAGSGAALSEQAVLKADPQEIKFLANLDGLITTLTEPVSASQQELKVGGGSDWPKGKRIVVCGADRCAESRLAHDGRRRALSLTSPLGQDFPTGSAVFVSNQVRYYVGRDRRGGTTVMRQVDGGANPLVGDVARFRLRYLDRDGKPTQDAGRVSRVRMEIAVGDGRQVLTREVGLRTA